MIVNNKIFKMKNTLTFLLTLLFLVSSCNAQLVKSIQDSKELMIHKEEFIGKSFKYLVDNIKPNIMFIYGKPDNEYPSASGSYIKLFFVPKQEFVNRKAIEKEPTGIAVTFQFEENSKRKPIPVGGIDTTKEYLMKEYGDMIVTRIYVTGEN